MNVLSWASGAQEEQDTRAALGEPAGLGGDNWLLLLPGLSFPQALAGLIPLSLQVCA